MTKYCGRVIVFFCADSSASPPLFVRGVQFLHTLESGNPEAARTRLSDVFLAETTDWIPAFEHVKKSTHPAKSSSFPRKRESRGGARKTLRCFSFGNERLDSRFRGNDEVLSVDYCLSLCRIFDGPAVICERRPISSHARTRESRGGARKIFRCFSCGNGRLDSRFRGNDEALFDNCCLLRCRYFRDPTVIVRALQFLHTLFRGKDRESADFRNFIVHRYAPTAGSGAS